MNLSFEVFVLIISFPYIIAIVCLVVYQRKFFERYNEVYHPKELVSVVDYAKKHNYNYFKIFQFLLTKSFNTKGHLYFKNHEDKELNYYAKLVKISFVSFPFIILFSVLIFIYL